MDSALADLQNYLDGSPSPWHAVASSAGLLDAAGFVRLDEKERWDDAPPAGYVERGGALVAWRQPSVLPTHFRLVGAHTDSPVLRVKPHPDSAGVGGWRQLAVEVYGGILNNSWLDRDLSIAGRVVFEDGTTALVDIGDPVARVPQLAIHLDRGVNEKGLVLDPQTHLAPVWGLGDATTDSFARWLAERAGTETPAWWELCLYDVQRSALLGSERELLASGRIDNQVSCWAAVTALVAAEPGIDHTALIALFDHEEVGSSSTTGAGGPLLEAVLDRLVAAAGGDVDDRRRLAASSSCISADGAHAVHPNYPERHDPAHFPTINAGPVIKINSNQRYATSADTAQLFTRACHSAGCDTQVFVSRNNMPCGSTIGPISATRLGIATVDVGVPQLSMHSARELCGTLDPVWLRDALGAYFSGV
jgi:aspartyl aminopeptidase